MILPAGFDPAQEDFLSGLFEDTALSFSLDRVNHDWKAQWIFDHPVTPPELQERLAARGNITEWENISVDVEALPDIDWVAHSYQALKPFSVGPFFIYGSHYQDALPKESICLLIEATTAFGSGTHGTTSGCLEILASLEQDRTKPRKIIDVGTGTGILAIAARKLWPDVDIIASDIDEESISRTEHHANENDVSGLSLYVANGVDHPGIQNTGPYDLVIANILAGPIKDMASDLAAITADAGYLLLSGMLDEQAEDVAQAFESRQFKPVQHLSRDGWTSLLMKR